MKVLRRHLGLRFLLLVHSDIDGRYPLRILRWRMHTATNTLISNLAHQQYPRDYVQAMFSLVEGCVMQKSM
jgi:hypothetical protein